MSTDGPSGVWLGTTFVPRDALAERALRLAGALRDMGVGPDGPVAVLARNDSLHLEAAMAAASLGASVLPLNWRWTGDEITFVLDDSRAPVLLGHSDLLSGIADRLPAIEVIWATTPPFLADAWGVEADGCTAPLDVPTLDALLSGPAPGSLDQPEASSAGLFYTSGTTGRPKGVIRVAPTPEQIAQRREVLRTCYGIGDGCRMLITTPLHHIFAQAGALTALSSGGQVVLMPRFDTARLLELVELHQITNAQMVPTMFVRLVRLSARERQRDLSSLAHVLHTGAPCPPEVKRAMIDWWGPIIWEQYGSTETGVVVLASPQDWLSHPGTVGRTFLGSEVRILDEQGETLPPGEVGLVYARMHGSPEFTYLHHPEAKAAATRAGLTTAGDLGYLDEDGFLYLADRSTDVVISGGVNIYPAEVEAVLLVQPGIVDAAVFGVDDPEYGERLVADLVVDRLAGPDVTQLRASLSKRLAAYKIPRSFRVVDNLPRDDSGKVSKRKLREDYTDGR
jgi:long-chain acyl-CoA synthetase